MAVSPSLKAYGISGRARLFEVVQAVRDVNRERKAKAPGRAFSGKSYDANALASDPSLELGYIVAVPRMAYYMEYSTRIYEIYLKYVAPEDMHVYSIDEVFIDATLYLNSTGKTAHEFAMMLIRDVLDTTGITATAGIGTNMYLCKIAMDIVAKHIPPDKDGVRIAELDEMSYREKLWDHTPLTDFWRVGHGISRKLMDYGMFTMGDVARCSVGSSNEYHNEDLLYRLFGVNAELLIDHAWGWEPTTIADIRAYKPESNSLSVGQVLSCAYTADKARIVIREMAEGLALDMVSKKLVTDQIVLTIGYDTACVTTDFKGEVKSDWYGRKIPKHAHGTENIGQHTSSTRLIIDTTLKLYDHITDTKLLIRRLNIAATHVISATAGNSAPIEFEQLDLFADEDAQQQTIETEKLKKEQRLQAALLQIKEKYGKNAILHGTSYVEGATGKERNEQIGGHRK